MVLEELLTKLITTRITDPITTLCQSLIILTQWYFSALQHIIRQVLNQPEMWNHQGNNVEVILRNINRICNENKCTCLLFIASSEEGHHWNTLTSDFHAVVTAVAELTASQQLQQPGYHIQGVLKEVEESFPFFQDKQVKLRYLLAKNIEEPFPVNYRISLELMLTHRKSVLFSNCTPDSAYDIISEIQSCLHLSLEDTVKVILSVGLDAVCYETQQYKWGAVFFVRIPSLLQKFLPKLLNGFYPILIDFMNERRVQLNQSQKLRCYFESFISAIMEAGLISRLEAEGIISFQRDKSSLLGEVTVAKNQLDKILSGRNEKVQKIVDLIEKSPVDIDCVLYCAAATGRLTQLTGILLNVVTQEQNKDTIFGLCFLTIFRMISIFGQRAVFKDISGPHGISHQNPIMSWFEQNWTDDGFSVYEKKMDQNRPDMEQILTKLFEPPKKGNDHCGPAISLLTDTQTIINMLIVANSRGNIDSEKVKIAITTLRDNSRVGFMIAFTTLLRLSLNGDSKISSQAKLYLPLYVNLRAKTKTSQV